nr:hypothetical protein [Lewinella sp. IMCC34191]
MKRVSALVAGELPNYEGKNDEGNAGHKPVANPNGELLITIDKFSVGNHATNDRTDGSDDEADVFYAF